MPNESRILDGVKSLSYIDKDAYLSHVKGSNSFIYGRVVTIILSQDDPSYKETNSLESIKFEPVHDRSDSNESGAKERLYLSAYKLHSSVRTPIINEIVPLYRGPSLRVQSSGNQFAEVFYYSDPVGIYTSVEHNAAPDENTIDSMNSFNSPKNKLNSYKNFNSGVSSTTSGTDTISSSDTIKLGEYFTEKGIKGLYPLEGDYKIEGRFGHSIRFSGTPSSAISSRLLWHGDKIGSPVIIIRNNQIKIDPRVNTAAIFEDINKDGSSIYFLSDQTVDLVLSSNNFDSYHQSNENSIPSNTIVGSNNQQSQASQSAVLQDSQRSPVETKMLPVTQSAMGGSTASGPNQDIDSIPDNEDDLNFVQIGEDVPVPLTQGVFLNSFNKNYKFVPSVNGSSNTNLNLKTAPTISLSSVNAINRFAGQVSTVPIITKNGKALLDLLALTEGTMGQGNFNGYDIMVTGKLVPGYTQANSNPPHPNIKIFIPEYNLYSSASGRYQFTINTWNLVAGQGSVLSKYNQDYACWKNILNSANVSTLLISKIDTDFDSFQQVINLMATQWASLPVSNDPKGLYKQAGRFNFQTLYTYYKQILSKYP